MSSRNVFNKSYLGLPSLTTFHIKSNLNFPESPLRDGKRLPVYVFIF